MNLVLTVGGVLDSLLAGGGGSVFLGGPVCFWPLRDLPLHCPLGFFGALSLNFDFDFGHHFFFDDGAASGSFSFPCASGGEGDQRVQGPLPECCSTAGGADQSRCLGAGRGDSIEQHV